MLDQVASEPLQKCWTVWSHERSCCILVWNLMCQQLLALQSCCCCNSAGPPRAGHALTVSHNDSGTHWRSEASSWLQT